MKSSTDAMELRRKPIPKHIFTPTQGTTTRVANHYLLYFNETESYQIVARSSIKKLDKEGSAMLIIRNKLVKGKVIISGSFLSLSFIFSCLSVGSLEDCESELGRQTRLSQQENGNCAILSIFSCINYLL
jgi:hypothetical protein